ncbi:MAG: hypothetical protein QXG75_02720, partial [Candidatus Caldarchaeum sp.]
MSFREPIVVVLGHVDHGKCVGPKTMMPVEGFGWLTAEEVFRIFARRGKVVNLSDGVAVMPDRRPALTSLSNSLKPNNAFARLVWRRSSPAKMVRIFFSNS